MKTPFCKGLGRGLAAVCCALCLSLAAAPVTAQTLEPAAETAAKEVTYRLIPEENRISSAQIQAGDVDVRIRMYIEDDPGTSAIALQFGMPEGVTLREGRGTLLRPTAMGTALQVLQNSTPLMWQSAGLPGCPAP